jgi:hypothetical protein
MRVVLAGLLLLLCLGCGGEDDDGERFGIHHLETGIGEPGVAGDVGDEIVAFPQVDYDAYPDAIMDAPGIQIIAASEADAQTLVRRLRGG